MSHQMIPQRDHCPDLPLLQLDGNLEDWGQDRNTMAATRETARMH